MARRLGAPLGTVAVVLAVMAWGGQSVGAFEPDASTGTSSSSAGYQAILLGTQSLSYSGNVKVPSMTCAATNTGRVVIAEVITTRTSLGAFGNVGLEVGISCSGKTTVYAPEVFANGVVSPMRSPVASGDTLQFTATASGHGVSGTLCDLKTTKTVSVRGSGGTPKEINVNAGSAGTSKWPPFKKVDFFDIVGNGKSLSAWHPVRVDEAVRTTPTKVVVEIQAGPLGPLGKAFSDIYRTNSP